MSADRCSFTTTYGLATCGHAHRDVRSAFDCAAGATETLPPNRGIAWIDGSGRWIPVRAWLDGNGALCHRLVPAR